MTTILNMRLREAQLETIQHLQQDFPNAQLRIEIGKKDTTPLLLEQRFWEIIHLLDWSDPEADDAVLEPAVKALAVSPVHHIYLFADMLAVKLFSLDARVFAEQIGADAYTPNRYFSPDNFLYARCCVIANGQKAYEAILQQPHLMPKDLTFEALLSLASKAYFRKTGKKFDYLPLTAIETYSNSVGWSHKKCAPF
jgi:Protein of unknown function (DUF4240)